MAPISSGNAARKDKKKHRRNRRRELENLVSTLQQENERLQAEARAAHRRASNNETQAGQIPRPQGSAGDGFNLRHAMGLAQHIRLYRSIQRTVRAVIGNAGLDHRIIWRQQPKEIMVKIFRVARKRQPYLRRFANDWATEEIAKQYLKNRRAYHRRICHDNDNDDGMIHYGPDNSDDSVAGNLDKPEMGAIQRLQDLALAEDAMDEDEVEDDDKGEGPSGTHHMDED